MNKSKIVLFSDLHYAPEWVYDNFIRRNDIKGK